MSRRGRLAICCIFACQIAALSAGRALAHSQDAAVRQAFTHYDVYPPTVARIVICHGFGCQFRTPVALTERDHAALARLMAPGKRSPAAERRALADVVAWLGRRVAPLAGTARAKARATGLAGDASQFDCIDASRNTTSYLAVVEQLGLMRHYEVEAPVARGFLIDGRFPHATAVIRERNSDSEWAVDSWVRDNGQRPQIMPLARWYESD